MIKNYKQIVPILILTFSCVSVANDIRFLSPPSGSDGTDIFDNPAITAGRVCEPEKRTKVRLLGQSEGILKFAEVEVLNGTCQGKVGWVVWSHIAMQPCG